MQLSEFIVSNMERIMAEWESYAKSLPPGQSMTSIGLRNDAERMLRFIAADIATAQTSGEQSAKSMGLGPALPNGESSAAHHHGLHRLDEGFSLGEMVSEYRALRASVTRLWLENEPDAAQHVQQLIRFNEAVDQILAESVARFTMRLDHDRDMFIAMLGHDLKNPLGSIMLAAAALLRSGGASLQRELLYRITQSGQRMDRMVTDLLEFARTRIGSDLPLSVQSCDLEEIARGVAGELQVAHPERAIDISVIGSVDGEWDHERIAQAVSNLVGNAVDHGDPQGIVRVDVQGHDDGVVMRVGNGGEPIPESEQLQLFEPLRHRAHSTARTRQRSLGLGLFIVRTIAGAHGGRVTLRRSDDNLTEFELWLPRAVPASRSADTAHRR